MRTGNTASAERPVPRFTVVIHFQRCPRKPLLFLRPPMRLKLIMTYRVVSELRKWREEDECQMTYFCSTWMVAYSR